MPLCAKMAVGHGVVISLVGAVVVHILFGSVHIKKQPRMRLFLLVRFDFYFFKCFFENLRFVPFVSGGLQL